MNHLRPALLTLFFLNASISWTATPDQNRPFSNKISRSQYVIHYDVRTGWRSLLTLNNPTKEVVAVDVTAFAPNGDAVPLESLSLFAREQKVVDLGPLVDAAGHQFATGALRLGYTGRGFGLNAFIRVISDRGALGFDAQALSREMYRSAKLEGVWWTPGGDPGMKIIVFNAADAMTNGTLTISGPDGVALKSLPLNLPPHRQRVVDLGDVVVSGRESFGGISITHGSGPGALMAHAFLYDRDTGLSINLPLHDPGTAGDTMLAGAGIRLGTDLADREASYSGRLLLRNVSSEATRVAPILQRGKAPRSMGDITLQPGETRVVEIGADFLPDTGEAAGIRMFHTGTPGQLIGYWFSVSDSGTVMARVPLESVRPTWHRGGNNPWTLEGNFSAVQYILNTGTEDAFFKARIATGNAIYFMAPRKVSPGETVAIDVRQLRDAQVPDESGTVIPWDATTGQLDWKWFRGPALIGELAQTVPTQKFFSPMYARRCCCTYPSEVTFWLSPSSMTLDVGQTFSFTPWEHDQDCNGDEIGTYNPANVFWSINPFIASIDPTSGLGSCILPGSANVTAQTNVLMNSTGSDPECNCDTFWQSSSATATLNVRPTITGPPGPNKVWWFNGEHPSGYATSITLQSSGGNTTSWSVTGNASSAVHLSATTGASTVVTSSGSSWSAAPGDVKITAAANGQTSDPFSLTALKPGSLVKPNVFTQCNSQWGYETNISYVIVDQLGQGLPSDIDWNESWTTARNAVYANTNWPQNPVSPGSALYNSVAGGPVLIDVIDGPGVNNQPANIPQPTCNATPSVEVVNWGQAFFVGTQTRGAGVRVQQDTLHKWVDHGVHTIP